MYSLNSYGNKHCVARDDSDGSSVDIAYQPSLGRAATTGSIDPSVCDLTSYSIITNSSLPDRSSRYLHDWYSFIGNFEIMPEVYGDDFLQEYATRCGYKFNKNFLLDMNRYKTNFIDKVDLILMGLSSSFSFCPEELKDSKNIIESMNEICSSFSKNSCILRSKCIDVLQCDIIPIIVRIIFNSKVIDVISDREMTYPEMEQLFLYFVSSLDKLIMVRIMGYWRDFCNKKKVVPSVTDVDYSNPFIYAHSFDEISDPIITCPSAFTSRFGECISFMAIAKIDEMMESFIGNCCGVLKVIVNSKCSCIFNCGDRVRIKLKKLSRKLSYLIEKEVDKKIMEGEINHRLSNFLKDVVVWNKSCGIRINGILICDNVIDSVRNFLINKVTSDSFNIVDSFIRKLDSSKGRFLSFDRRFSAIEPRWGIKLHPEDDYNILSIRRKFISKSRKIIKDKFCSILKEDNKFLDMSFDWHNISKKLFPIAQEAIRHLVDDEREELSEFLRNARAKDDVDVFCGSSVGLRKITSEERDIILKIYVSHLHNRNRNLANRIWSELINGKLNYSSKNINCDDESCGYEKYLFSAVDPTIPAGSSNFLVTTSSEQSELPVVASMSLKLLGRRDKIINMWGLNLHPDDDRLILFIRRKFSIYVVDHITKLFYGMIQSRAILPSGRVLRDSSWLLISGELSDIALKSIDHVTKNIYEELDTVLSKARIVDVSNSSSLSCVIRKVTDDEKKELVICARKIIDRSINVSIRSSWLRVVNRSSTDIGYGYKEKSKGIYGSGREGSWGVKLRYTDNTSILRTRRKFSSKVRGIIYNKFISMVNDKHRFEDGTIIGLCAWFRVSKVLFPIAQEEVKHILEDENRELEKVVSKARVVVDLEVDRELTSEETVIVLRNIAALLSEALKKLCRTIWDEVVYSLRGNCVDAETSSEMGCIDEAPPLSSSNVVDTAEVNIVDKDDSLKVKLCYEDDVTILNIKKKFSSEINRSISDKYSEIISKGYEFDDGTSVDICLWRKVSKKLLPVIKKEIDPIVENERIEINNVLLKSRADIYSPDSSSKTIIMRRFTSEERSAILKNIMESVDKQVMRNFSRIWNRTIKLPLVHLKSFIKEYKLELDNIRLEFIGNLGPVVNKVIDSLLSDIDLSSLSSLDDIRSSVSSIVSEKSCNLFNEEGFFDRVESLLSDAKIVDSSGNYRLITDEEKRCVLKEFMGMIDSDKDCLIKKRISKFKNLFPPTVNSTDSKK